MGCTVREKHVRPSRKIRSMKPEFDPCCLFDRTALSKSIVESSLKHLVYHPGLSDSGSDPGTITMSNSSGNFEDNGWGYCTEEQLEEILLKHLENLYNEAISKLLTLGYEEDMALRAVLSNGYCYGGMDVLTNILHNSLAYLNSNSSEKDQSDTIFTDLRQLEEYSLAGMVYLLQQVKPNLTKGDAMWCLLMSELHVGRASAMDIPSNGARTAIYNNVESVSGGNMNGIGVMASTSCRFRGGWGFGNGGGTEFSANGFSSYNAEVTTLQREIDCPRKFNLSSSMKSLLKRNVAAFAFGFRANMKHMQMQSSSNSNNSSCKNAGRVETCEQRHNAVSEESVSSVLEKFRDLNLEENLESVGEDQMNDVIVSLVHQIKDVEKQVKERKDWAHKKAIQAAQKVSNELAELRTLRNDNEETQRLKMVKQALEESTMKRLSEMENALRKASSQVDKANAIVKRLESENAEIRAEMEASKLSAAESLTSCVEAAKKEKKCLKKLLTWEKQRMKLQDEITAEKEKIKTLNRSLAQIVQEEKEIEAKWKQETKEKEEVTNEMEEEQRRKEITEGNNKRKLESIRLKIEIDFQRHKDDLQRLEQELSRLNTKSNHQSDNGKSNKAIVKLLEELDKLEGKHEEEEKYDRECMICKKEEVSVVFLPCEHQVVCGNCNESLMRSKGKGKKSICPCCRGIVHQRIRIFGGIS